LSLGSPPTGPAGPADEVDGVAFSPDETILAGSSGDAVWRWRFADPAHPGRPAALMPSLTGSTRQLDPVAFSRDGHTLVAADIGSIWRWDVTDQAHPVRLGAPLTGPAKDINAIAMSPVGDVLAAASGDGQVWRWSLADPARPAQLGTPLGGLAGEAYSVAYSRDGRYLAAGSYTGQVSRWNVASPAHPVGLGTLSGPDSIVVSVAFSRDGTRLAATSRDDKVWLWNLANPADAVPFGSPLPSPEQVVVTVVFSPDGQDLAIRQRRRDDPAVGPCRSGPAWPALTGPTGSVDSVALSPDGRILAATSAQTHPTEGEGLAVECHRPGPASPAACGDPAGRGSRIAAFSSDSTTLAVGGQGATAEVWLWNLTEPAHPVQVAALPIPASLMFVVESVAFSQVRNILAAGDGGGAILLWNVADPAHPVRLGRRALHGAGSNVSSVAISPDGELLAAASGTSVGLWSLAHLTNPAMVTTLNGPTKSVSKVAFGRGGKILAAGSRDTKVWLWSLADPARPAPLGQPLTTQPDMVEAVAFSPDGTTLAAGGQNGTTRIWNLNVDAATPAAALFLCGRADGYGGLALADALLCAVCLQLVVYRPADRQGAPVVGAG
jgi:WD40 repeat protein